MSSIIEVDLKEILAKLDQRLDRLDQKLDTVSIQFDHKLDTFSTQLNQKIDTFSTQLNQKIDTVSAELNQKIDTVSAELNQKIDTVSKDVVDLKVGQARLEEKVISIEKRMDFQEFLSKGVLFTLSTAVLGILAKLFGFINNP